MKNTIQLIALSITLSTLIASALVLVYWAGGGEPFPIQRIPEYAFAECICVGFGIFISYAILDELKKK